MKHSLPLAQRLLLLVSLLEELAATLHTVAGVVGVYCNFQNLLLYSECDLLTSRSTARPSVVVPTTCTVSAERNWWCSCARAR